MTERIAPLAAVGLMTLGLLAPRPVAAQVGERDTIGLSLAEALEIGLRRNPQVLQAGHNRSAAGAGIWDAYGNLLPQVNFSGQTQKSESGTFVILGTEFASPEQFTTVYQWDFVHSLLDSGRDLFRIKSARAGVDRAVAAYDVQALEIASDVKTQYLEARRRQAFVRQAEREIERLNQHLRLARARYDLGAVTRSDVLQAELALNQGEVARLQARQEAEEALLALRRLLGGALPEGPISLTTDFPVFEPTIEADSLVVLARELHPGLRQVQAQERVDEANLWIARSAYLPTLQFQYSLSRSVADSSGFKFSGFDDRNFYAVSLNWPLFGRFERLNQTSQASAALNSTREEARLRRLSIEESVRVAHSRLLTAWSTHRANEISVELAREDLRLGQGRYQTGTGSFVDLLDARVRAAQAETDFIASAYQFYLALAALERAAGVELFPQVEIE